MQRPSPSVWRLSIKVCRLCEGTSPNGGITNKYQIPLKCKSTVAPMRFARHKDEAEGIDYFFNDCNSLLLDANTTGPLDTSISIHTLRVTLYNIILDLGIT